MIARGCSRQGRHLNRDLFNGYRVSVWHHEKVLEMDFFQGVVIVQHCEYTYATELHIKNGKMKNVCYLCFTMI